jgi:hypothetical protein
MAEFVGGMKSGEYRKLTKRQRSILWLGAFVAAFFQGFICFSLGIILHSIGHGG